MKKIIPIDDRARILIVSDNYILQYRRKSEKQKSWRTAGNFPDLASLSIEYLNSSPLRDENAIRNIEELVHSIKHAESRIREIIINCQKNGTR